MDRAFVLLFVLAAALHTGESIKCYLCTSATDAKCGDPFEGPSSMATECSSTAAATASQYFNAFSNQLSAFASKLGIDNSKLPTIQTKFSCSKFEVQDGDKEVVIRGCLPEAQDACDQIKKLSAKEFSYCGTCDNDLCNSAQMTTLSSLMLFLMPALALLLASS